jgi:hypothetical protein
MVVAQTHLEDRLEELRTGTGDPASEAILVQALSKAIQDTVKTAIQASKLGIQSKIETRNLAIQADFMVCMDAALFDEGVNLSETQRRAFRERFRAEVMLHTGYDK